MSHRAQQDGVAGLQEIDRAGRHHMPPAEEVLRAPIEVLKHKGHMMFLADHFQDPLGGGNDFTANAVACDHGDSKCLHGLKKYSKSKMEPQATNEPQASFTIREIAISDAEAAARLSVELGYPVSTADMEARIRRIANSPDHVVFVGCVENSVVGWIDVGVVNHLQAEPSGEIGGFVVASGCRSTGFGQQLVLRAEAWARDRGLKRMVVRSQIAREAAHRFYLREGYERVKTSAVFTKALS